MSIEDGNLRFAVKYRPIGALERDLGIVVQYGDLEHQIRILSAVRRFCSTPTSPESGRSVLSSRGGARLEPRTSPPARRNRGPASPAGIQLHARRQAPQER